MVSSSLEKVESSDNEYIKIKVIQKNTSTILTLSLGIALFVKNLFKEKVKIKRLIHFIIFSFFIATIILYIIWFPSELPYYYRYLRDIKTNLLVFSLIFLVVGILEYLLSINLE